MQLDFTDATLSAGDEFRFSANIAGAASTTVVRVIDGTDAPASLGTDADGNTIIGIGAGALTDAAAIASNLQLALVAAGFTDNAPATGKLDVSATGASLTIQSFADEANFMTSASLPDSNFSDLQAKVDAGLQVAISAAQGFGTAQSQAASQKEFLSTLVDSLESGVGALIDADITAESSRLNALQTQQQLATQSLSIANQSGQLVLSLFR